MKFLKRIEIVLVFLLALSWPMWAQAQGSDVEFLTNRLRPHVHFLLDCSGSMDAIVSASNIFPGCPNGNCDTENANNQATRQDVLIGVLRDLFDTNGSAAGNPGDPNWYTAGVDDLGIQLGIYHFQGTDSDHSNIRPDPPGPVVAPKVFADCKGPAGNSGEDTWLRYRLRNDNDLSNAESVIDGLRHEDGTPIAKSLKFFGGTLSGTTEDDNALPWLKNPANDPAAACRKRAVVIITDGDETCESPTDNVTEDSDAFIAATQELKTANPDLKIYAVGFSAGLTNLGRGTLNRVAQVGGTDANADGDNDPSTGCYQPGAATCLGNAFFVTNAADIKKALAKILDDIKAGSYTLSLPRLALSRGSRTGVVVSYFTVGELPVWGPGLEHYTLDNTTGLFSIPKWNSTCTPALTCKRGSAVPIVGAQSAHPRRNFVLDPGARIAGDLFDFSNSGGGIVGNSSNQYKVAEFFPAPNDIAYDDFDSNGTPAQAEDAKSIVNWLNGNKAGFGGVTTLKWRTEANNTDYDPMKAPFLSMVGGDPTIVSPPNNGLALLRKGYAEFLGAQASRERITIVNTNSIIAGINDFTPDDADRVLHGFSGSNIYDDGELAWGLVARSNIPRFRKVNTQTMSYHDGKAISFDFNAGVDRTTPPNEDTPNWQTGYFTGLGNSVRGILALNVTNTINLIGSTNPNAVGTWEISNTTDTDSGGGVANGYANLGFTTAPLSYIQVRDLDFNTNHIIHPVLVVPAGIPDASDTSNPDNGRVVFFVNANNGELIREIKLGPLTSGEITPLYRTHTPGGITAKVAQDFDSQGITSAVYIGTIGGQIWKYDFTNLTTLADTSRLPTLIWDTRDMRLDSTPHDDDGTPGNHGEEGEPGFQGDDSGVVDVSEYTNPHDMPVVNINIVQDTTTTIKLVVYFGVPHGSDASNLPTGTLPRGPVIRYIDPNAGHINRQVVHLETAAVLADPNLRVNGDYLLPRQLYVNTGAQKADRILSWEAMFVINYKLYYLLFRPSQDPCGSVGASYLAGIDLRTGVDVNLTGSAVVANLSNGNDDSTENFQFIANAAASMVVDFNLNKMYYGYTNASGQVTVEARDQALGLPNGLFQTLLLM